MCVCVCMCVYVCMCVCECVCVCTVGGGTVILGAGKLTLVWVLDWYQIKKISLLRLVPGTLLGVGVKKFDIAEYSS